MSPFSRYGLQFRHVLCTLILCALFYNEQISALLAVEKEMNKQENFIETFNDGLFKYRINQRSRQ